MPEHGKDTVNERALPGGITEGSSSNAAIERRIFEIAQEIQATSSTVIDVSPQDMYGPRLIQGVISSDEKPVEKVVDIRKYRHNDSRTAFDLRQKRIGAKAGCLKAA